MPKITENQYFLQLLGTLLIFIGAAGTVVTLRLSTPEQREFSSLGVPIGMMVLGVAVMAFYYRSRRKSA